MAVPHTERLDRYLADQLSLSRTQAGRLVAAGGVEVDGKVARASQTLGARSLIVVSFVETEKPRTLAPHPVEIDIRYEDDQLIVIDKPAGMVVHPAPGHWDDTLVNALVARGTKLAEAAGASGRPGVVHRLDRDTSGLMLIAKTDLAHRRLGAAIAARQVIRSYAVLSWGHLDTSPQVVEQSIGRHPTDRKRMIVRQDGRTAKTTFTQVARFDAVDLLRADLGTGRTHQIRVHLLSLGHPVVGDPIYGGGGAKRITGMARSLAERIERVTPRQALHAALLRFRHPESGAWMSFRSGFPNDLAPALDLVAGQCDPADFLTNFGFYRPQDD